MPVFLSNMYGEQLQGGENYEGLRKCVCIGILDFKYFQCSDRYHTCYHMSEDAEHFRFSDMFELHMLELPKVPPHTVEAMRDDPLYQWALFFDADNDEEVNRLSLYHPSIRDAAEELERIATDPALRKQYMNRKLAIWDYNAQVAEQRAEEKRETAIRMLSKGWDVAQIAEITELPEERIWEIAKEVRASS